MRKSISFLLALMIALLAFGALAAATHSFGGDFIQTTQPPACDPVRDSPLISSVGRAVMGA